MFKKSVIFLIGLVLGCSFNAQAAIRTYYLGGGSSFTLLKDEKDPTLFKAFFPKTKTLVAATNRPYHKFRPIKLSQFIKHHEKAKAKHTGIIIVPAANLDLVFQTVRYEYLPEKDTFVIHGRVVSSRQENVSQKVKGLVSLIINDDSDGSWFGKLAEKD